jgi:hypothetical protein
MLFQLAWTRCLKALALPGAENNFNGLPLLTISGVSAKWSAVDKLASQRGFNFLGSTFHL